ncbi:radical SAM protein, partial [Candidatus Woesearchaeota archaeon]|nr:radical SAM protein [Candidatus Woesearchaeota archaeon]
MSRSKNPDLIWDDILGKRAKKIAELEINSITNTIKRLFLDRVTLFVTHKCNLKCKYCNGPHLDMQMDRDKKQEMLNSDFGLEQYVRCIDEWSKYNLQHLHFTGGEATLNKFLPDFVKIAYDKGIACTLTTNGTAKPELYRKLVENGLTEIRISIDSTVDDEFDELVGVKGACGKVKNSINELVKLRDQEQKDIFIILNACVGRFNLDKIKSTIKSLIDLNPDDAKLLVVAEEGEYVQGKARRQVVSELLEYARQKGRRYELLEKKIRTMFRRNSFGLCDCAAQYEMKHCYVPLTERTLDAKSVYPCSIYSRYKGKPIISADASFEKQQEAVDYFVRNHDCRTDSICKDNCTYCCKQYNLQVNKMIRADKILQKAEQEIITIDKISDSEIDGFLKTYEKIKNVENFNDNLFAIIKPQGMVFMIDIMEYLKDQSIGILKKVPIEDWSLFSKFLYYKENSDVEFRLAKNKAHKIIEPNSALYLVLENEIPEKKLFRIKREMREWLGEPLQFFIYN